MYVVDCFIYRQRPSFIHIPVHRHSYELQKQPINNALVLGSLCTHLFIIRFLSCSKAVSVPGFPCLLLVVCWYVLDILRYVSSFSPVLFFNCITRASSIWWISPSFYTIWNANFKVFHTVAIYLDLGCMFAVTSTQLINYWNSWVKTFRNKLNNWYFIRQFQTE